MKGTILDFSVAENEGVISGDDGSRYAFPGKEWKAGGIPQAGNRVDFEVEGRNALSLYLDQSAKSKGGHTATDDVSSGFYRSSDDKILAGVCAGLAHKWNVNRGGLRFVTFLLSLLFFFPLLLYIAGWIIFPARPTKAAG